MGVNRISFLLRCLRAVQRALSIIVATSILSVLLLIGGARMLDTVRSDSHATSTVLSALTHWAVCGTDLSERQVLPSSRWTIETWVRSCTAMDGNSFVTVQAGTSDARGTIVEFPNVPDTRIVPVTADTVAIIMPEGAEPRAAKTSFGQLSIVYVTVPQTDMVLRGGYQEWWRNPASAEALTWCREVIAPLTVLSVCER